MGFASNFFDFGPDDLTFDFGAANTFVAKLNSTAAEVAEEQTSFQSLATDAQQDFKGSYADVFKDHVGWAVTDAANLGTCLRTLSQQVTTLIASAEAENARRRTTRESRKQKYDELLREYEEASALPGPVTSKQPPTVAEVKGLVPHVSNTPPSVSPTGVTLRPREPATAGAKSAGGTTSGRPDKLLSFAKGVMAFETPGAGLLGAWGGFLAGLGGWGVVDEGGVIAAVKNWHQSNRDEAAWVQAFAQKLQNAGGQGSIKSMPNGLLEVLLQMGPFAPGSRAELSLRLPETFGDVPATGYAADPVNTATGNFIEPEMDLGFEGAAELLVLSRMYNSQDEGSGVFGSGWSSVLDARVVLSDEGAECVMFDGRRLVFPREDAGWGRALRANFWLTREQVDVAGEFAHVWSVAGAGGALAGEVLVLRGNQGEWWVFDTAGLCLGYGKGAGTSVAVVRDQDLRVTALVHEWGREIRVEYARDLAARGLVSRVTGADGERVAYRYDGAGRLIEVETAVGVRSYRWNADGLIDQVTGASGVVECVNTYDEQRRVVLQVTEFGREIEFSYVGRATIVADADGENTNSWVSDRFGRLVRVTDTDHQAQSMTYDQHSNLLTVIERDGAETVCVYDGRGRLTRRVSPEGVDRQFSYDDHDRVMEVREGDDPRVKAGEGRAGVRGEAVTRLSYAQVGDRWPSKVTDAEGGVTELVWDRGLLQRVTDPAGVVTVLSYTEHGDLMSVTDGVGNQTRVVRDGAGRVTEVIAPSGASERFTWEGGLLTGREAADGATWRYEYGAAGQLIAVVDPVGAKTSYEYGVHGRVERILDPLGRVTVCGFDAFGNPSQVAMADSSVWGLQHDGLSRLREVVDPVGNAWGREYGVTGEVTGTRDPAGVTQEVTRDRRKGETITHAMGAVSAVAFDRYDRPVTTTVDGVRVSEARYDLLGRVVEQVDAAGGVTRVTRDLAGKPVEVCTPEGRVTRVVYDLAGRPAEVVDPAGGVTKLRYDADSRVTRQVLPSGDVAVFEYDQAGRVLKEDVPGAGVTRYRYDAAGRLTWTQGPKFGRREFVYDQAGQLTRAVNGVGGVTHYEYDLLGRLVKVIDPAGGVTKRSYTPLGQVAEVTDPLGRTTAAEYDAAGKLIGWRDPVGGKLGLSYDGVGRLAQVSEHDAPVAEVRYESVWSGCVTDHTKATTTAVNAAAANGVAAGAVSHRVVRDPRGFMRERARDGQATTWGYDGDGLRTRLHMPDGSEVAYAHDGAGRVTRVEHPVFGVISYEYDADGHLTRSLAGDVLQSWQYEHGNPVAYTRTDAEGAATTRIGYDSEGRIAQVATPSETTTYAYDGAGQLTRAVTVNNVGVTVSDLVWEYDLAGRLTRRVSLSDEIGYAYDVAGQLLRVVTTKRAAGAAAGSASSAPAPSVTTYAYDAAGRRIAEHGPEGETRYAWSVRGTLTGITTTSPDGETTRREVWVDATGELAELDGEPVVWDTASGDPTPLKVGDAQVFRFPGSVTGAGETVFADGWRTGRASGVADPWDVSVLGAAGLGGSNAAAGGDPVLDRLQAAGIGITAHGSLAFNGLEHLGARMYQPGTHAFLSTDPLPAVTGAGWAGNPYAYAGNDPVGMLDPAGLSPLKDKQLDGVVQSMCSSRSRILAAECSRKNGNELADWFADVWKGFGAWAKTDDGKAAKAVIDGVSAVTGFASLATVGVPYVGAIFGVVSILTGLFSAAMDVAADPSSVSTVSGVVLTAVSIMPISKIPGVKPVVKKIVKNSLDIVGVNVSGVSSITGFGELYQDEDEDDK